jgi:hypothetical protein
MFTVTCATVGKVEKEFDKRYFGYNGSFTQTRADSLQNSSAVVSITHKGFLAYFKLKVSTIDASIIYNLSRSCRRNDEPQHPAK